MEDLTKQQIILLTLLVSFVTSIATGIVTVSLVDQAPKSFTQTINRVVERTIEKVVPDTTKSTQTVVKETVVVNEEDKVTEVVSQNEKAVVRLYKTTTDLNETSFAGLGVIVSAEGRIATAKTNTFDPEGMTFSAELSDGRSFALNLDKTTSEQKNYIFSLATTTERSKLNLPAPLTMAKTDAKLGQSVVALAGEKKNSVFKGYVVSFTDKIYKEAAVGTSTPAIETTDHYIDVNFSAENLIHGSPLFNLNGELIGLKNSADETFMPVSVLARDLKLNSSVKTTL